MTQKFSWSLLVAGVLLFLFQVSDVIQDHSTWSELVQPVNAAEIMRTFAAVGLAITGALGVQLGRAK